MTEKDFDQYFGRRWIEYFDSRYFVILVFTLLSSMVCILTLANMDFSSIENSAQIAIKEKYYRLAISFADDTKPKTPVKKNINFGEATSFTAMKSKLSRSGILKAASSQQNHKYDDLPLDEGPTIDFEELSYEDIKSIPRTMFSGHGSGKEAGYSAASIEDLLRDPYSYKIDRRTNMFLDIPEYFKKDDSPVYGYRDQDKVLEAIYSKQNIIEECYQRQARMNLVSRGFVKVEFEISPSGQVLPKSIRILNSTIRNRAVEQCIKKHIAFWHNFETLDESRGIAHVIHKFVFN